MVEGKSKGAASSRGAGGKNRRRVAGFDASSLYPLRRAVELVRDMAWARFDETVDVALRLGVDVKRTDQMVRGSCALPHGSGRVVRVAVFATGVDADAAREAGADLVGAEDLAEKVRSGSFDFDRCVATPAMMGLVGPLGCFLGPRGLMPNPKLGTVTVDVAKAVRFAKGGSVEFRTEKAGVVHAAVGKVSFSVDNLVENILSLVDHVLRLKPPGSKGTYLRSLSISSTMGAGVGVDLSSVASVGPSVPTVPRDAKVSRV